MNWLIKTLNSSIGQKVIMSLTGLFLCSFLIIHMIGNLQLFYQDEGLAFNRYAVFMTTNPVIKVISYVLYASILFHAFKGLHLVYKNNKARPVKYAKENGRANSHWTSRSMGILGTMLLIFIAVHMSDFWWEYHNGPIPYTQYTVHKVKSDNPMDTIELTKIEVDTVPSTYMFNKKIEEFSSGRDQIIVVKDLYKEVSEEFKEWPLVLLYLISMFALSFHLYHGFKSAFQSLGLNHSRYNGLINFIGIWIFSIIIPLCFAAMPVYFFIN